MLAKMSVEQSLMKASSYAKKGEVAEAQKLYQAVLQAFSKNKRAQQGLAALKKTKPNNTIQSPPQEAVDHLVNLYNQGQIAAVIEQADVLTEQYPGTPVVWNILGVSKAQIGKLYEAIEAYKKSISLKPDYAEAHNNLGSMLQELGRLDEALASYTQAIALKPNLAEAHGNLGNTFQELSRLDEALASYTQAIALKPDFADAHYNLGNTLKSLGRLEEAEAIYTQAIALKPDLADAHNNLGTTLKELGRLEEAEASYQQAIALKPDLALAHTNLGRVLFNMGYQDLALKSIEKANHIDPQSKESRLILSVIKSRKSREISEAVIGDARDIGSFRGLTSNPLKLQRAVEAGLITKLYGINSNVKKKLKNDARFGTRSSEFNLLEDSSPIIQSLAADLTRIMMEAVKSDVYVYDAFFNILGAGGGTIPHHHLNDSDKDIDLNLGKQKYSLQYYLSVGDQNCSEPGMLKLYEPVEDILPGEGMITIIPANRMHSAVYNGKTDRVMIGINFYSL